MSVVGVQFSFLIATNGGLLIVQPLQPLYELKVNQESRRIDSSSIR